jgi:hypothetical protein
MNTKLVRAVSLIALQDPIPANSVPNRIPLRRFAAVFINVHNADTASRWLCLERIEVIAIDSRMTQLCQEAFEPIRLKPGESRTLDVFLEQDLPYDTTSLLKAIVIYSVEGKTQVAGSMAVPVRSSTG